MHNKIVMEYFKILVYTIAIIVGIYQLITNKFVEEKRKVILNKFLFAFFILFLIFQLIDIFKSI
jgi:hypothetical protein